MKIINKCVKLKLEVGGKLHGYLREAINLSKKFSCKVLIEFHEKKVMINETNNEEEIIEYLKNGIEAPHCIAEIKGPYIFFDNLKNKKK
jgi:hypothetical protein